MLKKLLPAFAFVVLLLLPAQAEIGEDGLHKEDWFALTFRDVGEDIAAAAEQGKRLAIVFEQRGCIYCAKMHEELLSDPEVRDFIKVHFMVVQYNMFGDEEVTDLDGEVLTEKTAARKWGFVFTPTIAFLPEAAPEGKTVDDPEFQAKVIDNLQRLVADNPDQIMKINGSYFKVDNGL